MKKFTVEEAQEVIPLLKPILKEIKSKAYEYSKYMIEVARLIANFRNSPYDTEGVLDRVIDTRKELRELVGKVENYSVILRDVESGTVDFPSKLGDDDIMLCFRAFEESEIRWWHKAQEPCSMRKPLKKLTKT